ncbi:MAG: ATPase, T2SS/T4P/T4SS family, partial [Alphaproteobacteria bacterium]
MAAPRCSTPDEGARRPGCIGRSANHLVPQDGRMQVNLDGRSLDLRVSSLPTAHGESVVMRILDQEGLKPGLPEL